MASSTSAARLFPGLPSALLFSGLASLAPVSMACADPPAPDSASPPTTVSDAPAISDARSRTARILDGYRSYAELVSAMMALKAGGAEVTSIGRSRQGKDIHAIRIGSGRPAILLTAGLDGQHLAGAEVALRMASELLGDGFRTAHPALLAKATIWIVPCANPDALEATRTGAVAQRGTLRPFDDDRDGTVDEDPPSDLDGDGAVTEMRVRNPPSPYVATLIADATDSRLMKSPDQGVATKGYEAPTFAVFTEGDDLDGDGRIAEDGLGEVDLNRNFPHRYPEFAKDAGPYQMSEPESKALADFVLAHPEIVAAITYGRHDTLVRVPEGRDNDATGRTPLLYAAGDIDLYQAIGKLYRDTTGQARSGAAESEGAFWLWLADHRGLLSMASTMWGRPDVPKPAADQAARPDASTSPGGETAKPSTPSPEPPPPPPQPDILRPHDGELLVSMGMLHDEEEEGDVNPAGLQTVPANAGQAGPAGQSPGSQNPSAQGASPQASGSQAGPGGRGGPPGGAGGGGRGRRGGGNFQPRNAAPPAQASATSDPESSEWLAYSDAMRGGVGFVPWHEIMHPVFGLVEVGGFHPLFRVNPPAGELDALASKQTAFVAELLERLPQLAVEKPKVTALGAGLYRVESSVTNSGRLPTAPTMGVTTRARAAVIARISTEVPAIVSGERVRKIESLAPGARVELAWIMRAGADESVAITVGNDEYGVTTFTFRNGAILEETR
jgi:hypothetical protein